MFQLRLCAAWLLLVALPGLALAQAGQKAIVMFKDGFYVKGTVAEMRTFMVDSATGKSFDIPVTGGLIYVDDTVRKIYFSPNQVQSEGGIVPLKPGDLAAPIVLKRYEWHRRSSVILPNWEFLSVSPWNEKWMRTIKVNTHYGKGNLDIDQWIVAMTPQAMHVLTKTYNWDMFYLTPELGPTQVRSLAYDFLQSKKELKDTEKTMLLARFLQQCGWPEAAEKELTELIQTKPGEVKEAEAFLENVREQLVGNFVEDLERRAQVGQHGLVQDKLKLYDKQNLGKLATAKQQLAVQDLKTKFENAATQLETARRLLKELPAKVAEEEQPFWKDAAKALDTDLGPDLLGRLETFLDFGQQHLRELKDQRKPGQTTEEVLALAVTGWLQGNQAAEPDAKMAQKLFEARQFLLEYLSKGNGLARGTALAGYIAKSNLPVDVLARLVRLLPPSHAHDKLGTEVQKLTTAVPETEEASYVVQLPPNYSHQRSYPVLVVLHGAREDAETLMKRWEEQASKHGFILVAPLWSSGLRASYEYSPREHNVVLTTLRDLRRKFQIDSDRVFLFGWEQGGEAAFDIGLSHPDQFAGVLPMNGKPQAFSARYWPNAQYLPFYVVEGDRNGVNSKMTRGVFKDWVRCQYASLYIEYKGRASEWYAGELPSMMNWMTRKKRYHPNRQLGRYNTGGSPGSAEEFRSLRDSDNRYYWLSTDAITKTHLVTDLATVNRVLPATLQGELRVGNELERNAAKIWSQFNIRTSGVKQVTLWLEEGMIDFAKPVRVRVNGEQFGADRVIPPSIATMLEELAVSGDRQRLCFARVDMKLK